LGAKRDAFDSSSALNQIITASEVTATGANRLFFMLGRTNKLDNEMSLLPSPDTGHAASTDQAQLLRNKLLGATQFVVTKAKSLPEDSTERGRAYAKSGIISYAQNREDILLWRALHDLPNGFYIDVGAEDPTRDSVTLAFYQRGWRGINVEPVQGHFDKLLNERPRDLTFQVAVGDRVGWNTLYEFPDTGLSTLVQKIASRHKSKGLRCVERRVPIVTLNSLWENFVEGEVHFLKIDVEGYERQVLNGMTLTRFRPWIILIEATEPRSSEGTWQEWENQIFDAQYEFVHFDGFNRWYLAEERSQLRNRFEAPPNVFDEFEIASTVAVRNRLAAVEHELAQIRKSASWQWTAPLRAMRDVFSGLVKILQKIQANFGNAPE
jgi:FkbM family methyltransferase